MTTINRSLDEGTRREFHARLREARSQLLRTIATTEEELATLESRELGGPLEDAAREEGLGILARLGDQERREMEELDAPPLHGSAPAPTARARAVGGVFR